MKIDTDVAHAAAHFGLDPKLLQAVVIAEGNILRAVQCSIPSVSTREDALLITCRSAVHAMSDYIKANAGPDFVAFWGSRWAPEGVKNDPHNLNANWTHNTVKGWLA